MLDLSNTEAQNRIIVALDCPCAQALDIAQSLKGRASWIKVGMTLYYAEGPAIVSAFKDMVFKVFLDLKFHDIPHQVRGAAASATRAGADMLTVHSLGGTDMMRAALKGAQEAADEASMQRPVLLGITVLTSMSQVQLEACGINSSIEDQVLAMAGLAQGAGLDGVVASPSEAASLRQALGSDAYIVTPGVRPLGSDMGDQHRVATPAQAFAAGASHIVVGRPIVASADPVSAFEEVAQSV